MCVRMDTRVGAHVHTHEYHPAIQKKKNEMLPFATTWINLREGMMLSEMYRQKTNTV